MFSYIIDRVKIVIFGVFIALFCGACTYLCAEAGYSEEYIRKVVEDKKDYKGEWENRVIITRFIPKVHNKTEKRGEDFILEQALDMEFDKKYLHFYFENGSTVQQAHFHHFHRKNIGLFRLGSHAYYKARVGM